MILKNFIGRNQLKCISEAGHEEEGDFFKSKMAKLNALFCAMPRIYETDGQGDEAIAYLHYFNSDSDWYITERDFSSIQHQAFGLAVVFETELGYISIEELIRNNVELDLYWTPVTLKTIKAKVA
jgi:hypothetical protein